MVTVEQLSSLIRSETITLLHELEDASNVAFIATVGDLEVVYKPVAGETPLWDFPQHSLSQREVMASWVDRHFGWNLIPPTVWSAKGPHGPGSVQLFVRDAQISDVNIFVPEDLPESWIPFVEGTMEGKSVLVAHSHFEDVQRLAALDVIMNNADRKAGHILRDANRNLQAIDHGVCFHSQFKLRSVLWGWVGESLPVNLREEISRGLDLMKANKSEWLLSEYEFETMLKRADDLLRNGFPEPSSEWPAIPWPIF